jgi:hypothetical protein
MALTLIKETGAGLTDANAYANAADGDAYHAGHLYATAWTAASAANKDAALVMATRLIDGEYQFAGWKTSATQALQWPRASCLDPDAADADVPADTVPPAVVAATCELARELLVADRTAAPPGEGLKYESVGTTQTGYDKTDKRPVIPPVAQALLGKFGTLLNRRSGAVRLMRA